MRALSLTLGALSALVAVSNSAILQKKTLVFPKGFAKLEGPQSAKHSGRGAPWTQHKKFRYMQAIDFGNSLKGKIQAIAMRRDSSSLSGPPFQTTPLFFTDIELWLSTAGLTNIFAFSQNFNRNIGRIVVKVIARKRINFPPVRSVPGVLPQPSFGFRLPFDKPFQFNGAVLVMDIRGFDNSLPRGVTIHVDWTSSAALGSPTLSNAPTCIAWSPPAVQLFQSGAIDWIKKTWGFKGFMRNAPPFAPALYLLSGGLAKNPIKLPSGCFFNLALPSLFLAMPATTDGSGAALTPRLIIAYDRKFAGITVAGQWLVLDPKSSKLLASNWAQTQIHEWLDKAVYPTAFTSAFFNSNAQRGIFVSIGQTPVLEFTYQ